MGHLINQSLVDGLLTSREVENVLINGTRSPQTLIFWSPMVLLWALVINVNVATEPDVWTYYILCSRGLNLNIISLGIFTKVKYFVDHILIYFLLQGYGLTTDDQTIFVNASTCNLQYNPCNPAIVFDMDIPDGHTKDNPISISI